MQIECPHCQTIFKLTEEQLHVADGMVRCGLCHEVFNALQNNDSPANKTDLTTEQTTLAEDTAGHSTTGTHDKKDTTDITATAFDQSVEKNNEKPSTDELFDGVQSKLIPDEFRIPELHKPYSIWRDMAWSIAIITLTISLFAEYAWFNRNQFVTRPELKPWIGQLCETVDCNTLGLRDANEIEMVARNIYSHPNVSNGLMVSVTMINHAVFSQPHPAINIDFSDVRGKVIASRVFSPEEYLQLNSNAIKLLHSGVATDFHLEIQDPGPEAMTYEFNFL